MDPHKVDRIANWKVPTNASLVAGFTGMVQYLARDCHNIAEPLGVLSRLQGNKPWKWGPTEQRAFEEVKRIVSAWRNNSRVALDRSPKADPIGVSVDASNTGAGGVIWQGPSADKARIIAFWSGRFNSAEQNYPTIRHQVHYLHGSQTLGAFHETEDAVCETTPLARPIVFREYIPTSLKVLYELPPSMLPTQTTHQRRTLSQTSFADARPSLNRYTQVNPFRLNSKSSP